MTTPSGQISLSQVNVEIQRSSTAQVNMNFTDLRTLAGVGSGQISMSQLRSKSWIDQTMEGVYWGSDGLTPYTVGTINTATVLSFAFQELGGYGQFSAYYINIIRNYSNSTRIFTNTAGVGATVSVNNGDVLYFEYGIGPASGPNPPDTENTVRVFVRNQSTGNNTIGQFDATATYFGGGGGPID